MKRTVLQSEQKSNYLARVWRNNKANSILISYVMIASILALFKLLISIQIQAHANEFWTGLCSKYPLILHQWTPFCNVHQFFKEIFSPTKYKVVLMILSKLISLDITLNFLFVVEIKVRSHRGPSCLGNSRTVWNACLLVVTRTYTVHCSPRRQRKYKNKLNF